jgi:RNA polymerase sigma factor (sigma-70 family)
VLHHLTMPPPAEGFASRHLLGPALRTQSDRRLVKLVRDGYEAAFEEIVRRYGRPLNRYAASIVGGRSEDVTQDAFSKALLALRRDGAEIELRPWLFRIVRNTALNDLRDSPPAAEVLAEALAGGRSPAEELEQREELADLMKRLQALPEPQRAAIVMRELEGLGHEEIAAALGLTGGAARQAIHRARRALRNGAGMLLPLPLLESLLAGAGPTTAEAAVGAAGLGGTAGASVALKATAATVLVAGAVGTGAVIDQASRTGDAGAAPPPARQAVSSDEAPEPPLLEASGDEGASEGRGPGEENEGREDNSGKGSSGDGRDDSSEPGERSGPGGGDDRDDDRRGPSSSDRSGPGHGGSQEDLDDEDRSGSNSGSGSGSRSGHGGSGSSGSGGSGSGGGEFEIEGGSSSGPGSGSEPLESGSGSGSSGSDDDGDSSGSGSGGSSGSSGSGSSGDDEPDD